jgi:hypothetical protein
MDGIAWVGEYGEYGGVGRGVNGEWGMGRGWVGVGTEGYSVYANEI